LHFAWLPLPQETAHPLQLPTSPTRQALGCNGCAGATTTTCGGAGGADGEDATPRPVSSSSNRLEASVKAFSGFLAHQLFSQSALAEGADAARAFE
jgi:hypothetical protein